MTQEDSPTQSPLMEVRNITKEFPGVKALDAVSVEFFPGEVHVLFDS